MPCASKRILAYDRARAMALIGMVVVNSTKIMDIRYLKPWWADALIALITGRAAVVFVMLAGAGMAIAYDRAPERSRLLLKMRLFVRALMLGIIGLFLLTVWSADILHFYTVYIFFGICLLGQRKEGLKKILGILLFLSLPVCAMATYEYEGGAFLGDLFNQGALALPAHYFFMSNYYPVLPWFCFFLVGMLFGRLERFPSESKLYRIFIGSCALFIAIELFSALLNDETIAGRWFDIEMPGWRAFSLSEAFPVGPLFVFSAGASGLALISFFRFLPERAQTSARPSPITAFGRMSLTVYLSHILIGHLFNRLFVSQGSSISSNQMIGFATAFILSGILFADRWMRHFKRGPVETILHELTDAFLRLRRQTLPADA